MSVIGFCIAGTSRTGLAHAHPKDHVTSVCGTVRPCLRAVKGASGEGIGIDGQMADGIGINLDGKHITPHDFWLDTRCTPYVQEMLRRAGPDL